MMLVGHTKPPSLTPLCAPFSLGTFIKHLQLFSKLPSNSRSPSHSIITSKSLQFETLNPNQKHQIHLYVHTLLDWNQKMNLTAVREVDEVMERHIEDSLAILPPIEDSFLSHCGNSLEGITAVDVGSGAGLPGLVLAIARPDWKVTLLESMKKRCTFLEHAVSVTGLSNVKIVRGRAEELGQSLHFREHFDVAVSRAVAEMRVLAEYCLPLVRVGGLFFAAKGHDPEVEVKRAETAIHSLGASLLKLYSVDSYGPYGQRTVVVCLKKHSTSRKYPRNPGTPAKEPL